MAQLERDLTGDFDETLCRLHDGILNASMSASYESGADWSGGGARCALQYDAAALRRRPAPASDRNYRGRQSGSALESQYHRGGSLPRHAARIAPIKFGQRSVPSARLP